MISRIPVNIGIKGRICGHYKLAELDWCQRCCARVYLLSSWFLGVGTPQTNLQRDFRGNIVPVHLWQSAPEFFLYYVKGLSKYRGTFKLATCAFEESVVETWWFTRSKIHSFVKFSGKLASRSINSCSQWMSVFFIKRGEKKEKKSTFRY